MQTSAEDQQNAVGDATTLQQNAQVQNDLVLVQRLLAREETAWAEFVDRYQRLIDFRIASACVEAGRAASAEQLVSEISCEFYSTLISDGMRVLASFAGRSRLSTWIAVIARRLTFRYLARQRKHLQPQRIDTAAGIASAEAADGVAQEQLQQMQLARTQLLQADQDVLRLFYDERRPYEEIASLLGISTNAVGPKLDRARRRLKSLLQQPSDAARPPD